MLAPAGFGSAGVIPAQFQEGALHSPLEHLAVSHEGSVPVREAEESLQGVHLGLQEILPFDDVPELFHREQGLLVHVSFLSCVEMGLMFAARRAYRTGCFVGRDVVRHSNARFRSSMRKASVFAPCLFRSSSYFLAFTMRAILFKPGIPSRAHT